MFEETGLEQEWSEVERNYSVIPFFRDFRPTSRAGYTQKFEMKFQKIYFGQSLNSSSPTL